MKQIKSILQSSLAPMLKMKQQPQDLAHLRSVHTPGSALPFLSSLNSVPRAWHSTPKASLLLSPFSSHVHQLYGFSTNYTCGAELGGTLVRVCSLMISQPTANPSKQRALSFRHTHPLQAHRQEARISYFDTSVRTHGRYTQPLCSKIWRLHTIMSPEVHWYTSTSPHTILTRHGCGKLVQLEASHTDTVDRPVLQMAYREQTRWIVRSHRRPCQYGTDHE